MAHHQFRFWGLTRAKCDQTSRRAARERSVLVLTQVARADDGPRTSMMAGAPGPALSEIGPVEELHTFDTG